MLEKKNYTSEEIRQIDDDLSEKLRNLSKIIISPISNDELPENTEKIIKDAVDFIYNNITNIYELETYHAITNLRNASSIFGGPDAFFSSLLGKDQGQSEQNNSAAKIKDICDLNFKRKIDELYEKVSENNHSINPSVIFAIFDQSLLFCPIYLGRKFRNTNSITQIVKIFHSDPDKLKILLDKIHGFSEEKYQFHQALNLLLKEIVEIEKQCKTPPEECKKYHLYCLATFFIANNFQPIDISSIGRFETASSVSIFDLIDKINPDLLKDSKFVEIKNIKDNINALKDISQSRELIAKIFSIQNKCVKIHFEEESIVLKFSLDKDGKTLKEPIELSIPRKCLNAVKEIITKCSPQFDKFGDYSAKTITRDKKKYIEISFKTDDVKKILEHIHDNSDKLSKLFKPSKPKDFSTILIEYNSAPQALKSLPVALIKQRKLYEQEALEKSINSQIKEQLLPKFFGAKHYKVELEDQQVITTISSIMNDSYSLELALDSLNKKAQELAIKISFCIDGKDIKITIDTGELNQEQSNKKTPANHLNFPNNFQ